MDVEVRNQIVTILYDCYATKGFITEDEALLLFAENDTPLNQIDSITEQLLTMGVIIATDDDEDEDISSDRTKTDYHQVFDEAVKTYPELESVIEYIRNITRPRRNEWQKLMPQAQNGNEFARIRLIEMYLRVCVRQALDFSKRFHLSFEDTLQDGIVGVISAIENYNPSEHMNLTTTIQWRISQAICRNQWVHNNPTYIPVHMKEKLFDIMEDVEAHYCDKCPDTESPICNQLIEFISAKKHWTKEETVSCIEYLCNWTSLDALIERNVAFCDNGELMDEVLESLDVSFNNVAIFKAIDDFKEREKEVILLRYGFTDKGVLTLEEIGQILNVTRERVRQIEAKCIEKLRVRLSQLYFD